MVEDSLIDVIKNNKMIEPLGKKKGQRVFTDRSIPAKIKGVFRCVLPLQLGVNSTVLRH
jgi:hypothetical protein